MERLATMKNRGIWCYEIFFFFRWIIIDLNFIASGTGSTDLESFSIDRIAIWLINKSTL